MDIIISSDSGTEQAAPAGVAEDRELPAARTKTEAQKQIGARAQ